MSRVLCDEFDSLSPGAHWTQHDSTPAGSTFTLTGSHLSLVPKKGSDFFFVDDTFRATVLTAPTWVSVPAAGYTYAAGLRNAQVRLFTKRVFDGGTAPAATAQFNSYETLELPTAADWQLFE